jgi:hypothetical protein
MQTDFPLLAFFGHHKCASTWIHRILGDFGRHAGLEHAYLYDETNFDGDLAGYIRKNGTQLISYVNAETTHISGLPPFRVFHVVRDPRDLLVSAYFSHLHSHPTKAWPELIPHRERLKSSSKTEGLILEVEFLDFAYNAMREWDYGRPDTLELRQEELTRAPYDGFLEIFRFLGVLDSSDFDKAARARHWRHVARNVAAERVPGLSGLHRPIRRFPAEPLLGIVYEHRFDKLAGGRTAGNEDVKSHYRKGTPGDWRNHFDDEVMAAFKERHGDLVTLLGYERTEDWGLEPRPREPHEPAEMA